MTDLKSILDEVDRHVLTVMAEAGSNEFDWVALPLDCFTIDGFDREMARAVCRSLRNRGLARFEKGLFNEDYEMAGAGYRITDAGREHLESLPLAPQLAAALLKAREGLEEIAKQKKTNELDTEYDVEVADFEAGYDMCVDRARAALDEFDALMGGGNG